MGFRSVLSGYLSGIYKRIRDGIEKSVAYPYRKISYAQEGEDLILTELLGDIKTGRFIDIGAFHPFWHSNTYLFYTRGWRGVNIDANNEHEDLFRKYRKGDVNLFFTLSSKGGMVRYYRFRKSDLNTIVPEEAEYKVLRGFELKDTIEVESRTLMDALVGQAIDDVIFVSIDVEGHELEVLKGIDWSRLSPLFIMVEILRHEQISSLSGHPIVVFLKKENYEITASTSRTIFFKKISNVK